MAKLKKSAGIMMYRVREGRLEVLLVHPGGPFWAKKDLAAWSIPKGEANGDDDDLLETAKREFEEETGAKPPEGNYIELQPIKQKAGKTVVAWAVEGNFDTTQLKSNTFTMEFPPRSGKVAEFPEVDRAEWFSPEEAKLKINPAQIALVEELIDILKIKR